MQEKTMVSDALNTINSGLKTYSDMISQSENQELRNILTQMRNETEKSQFELYQIAKNKNYYTPAQKASQDEINNIKSIFTGSTGWSGNQNSSSNSGMGSSMSSSSGMSSGVSANSGMTGSTSMGGESGVSSTLGR